MDQIYRVSVAPTRAESIENISKKDKLKEK